MDGLITAVYFVLIFGLVVVSHEFGHFIIAKRNGIHVVEFGIGMGPDLFSFKKGETKYALKLFPIGGACVFEGEDGLNNKEDGESSGAFPNANVWARIATVAAGPIFNFILAFIIALILVNSVLSIRDTSIAEVVPQSAAENAGLQAGDVILSLNGEKMHQFKEITLFMQLYDGGEIRVVYQRGEERLQTTLVPLFDEEESRYLLGVLASDEVELKGFDGIRYSWYEVMFNVRMTYKSLGMLFTGKVGRKDVAGPVGIAVNVVNRSYEEAKAYGGFIVLMQMLNITLMLSVNLGILNLLPLPALDGGRLVFLFLEVLRGKPVSPEKEGLVHFIGLMFFMALMVFVFFNDLSNIFMK